MTAAMTAAERIALWRRDPVQMVRDLFRAEPDAWQARALRAFPDPAQRRIAMQACAGPGKSTVMAWCAWNFLLCYADVEHHPVGACVSITGDNLKNGLWKELNVWYQKSDLLQRAFEVTSERARSREFPATWYLEARTFPRTADQDALGRTLSGLHSKYIAYFCDETGDMPPAVLRAAEQGLGNCAFGKIMQAGNTTSHTGALYQAASTQRHLWTVISITADPDDPERTPRVDAVWAQEQIDLYGRDNPWVMAFILGKFPPGSINALLGVDDVEAALGRGLRHESEYTHVQKRLGIDVARFGDDRTVLFPRQGLMTWQPVVLRNARSHTIAGRVATLMTQSGVEQGFIDDTGGWGAGTIDACLLGGIALVPVNSGHVPDDPRFFNKRSEVYFRAAEWVKRGGCLPQGLLEIVAEATTPTYWFEKGKLRVEEKDQIKKRLGRSPDLWDALTLTFAQADVPRALGELVGITAGSTGRGLLADYEPFASEYQA